MGNRLRHANRRKQVAAALLILIAGMLLAPAAGAQGGLAMSGSFYRQSFEIPQGSSVNAPSIYVIVFNQGSEEFGVRMAWEAPAGVEVLLSEEGFTLKPGEQKKVLVGVAVSHDTPAGEYTINLTAESYRAEAQGIQLLGAAGQSARLVVLGASATVHARTISPSGDPVPATVRLFRLAGDARLEVAYAETGDLEVTVAPGRFVAAAYMGGQRLGEETFDVADGEAKTVTLTVATVYFEGFGVVPNYRNDNGALAFADIVYTLNNLYQAFPEASTILTVDRDGVPLAQIQMATLAPLEKGSLGLHYAFIPADGWVAGEYAFQALLSIGGQTYAASPVETLRVEPAAEASLAGKESGAAQSRANSGGINWALTLSAAGGTVLIGLVPAILARRRKKARPEQKDS
ncbi:MAG: hypothetical protein H5T65_10545 [Chloroflexi bacterium]|nr:hypothetical protein [Chloroflexota bacterium]